MSNFINVFKVQFLSGLMNKKNGTGKNGKKKRNVGTIVVYAIMSVYIAIISAAVVFASPKDTPVGTFLTMFATMTTFLTLLTAVTETKRSIFDATDFEFLSSLPIRPATVVSGKIMAIYASEMIFSVICFIVPAIIVSIMRGPTLMLWITTIVGALLLPAIPMVVGSIFGFLFSLISAKLKHASIIETVLYIAFFIGIYGFSYSMFYNMGKGEIPNVASSVGRLYPLAKFISEGASGNVISLLIFSGISVATLLFSFIFLSFFYKRRGLLAKKSYTSKYSYKGGKTSGVKTVLLKKDIGSMFANPGVSINLFMGIVLPFVFPFVLSHIGEAVLGMSVMIYSMVAITTYAFTLEGRGIELLKSYPVSFKDICFAKIANHLIFVMGSGILYCTLVVLYNKVDIRLVPCCLLAVFCQAMFNSTMGLLRDVKRPKLDWTSEVQAVKQNTGMLVIMLFSMPVGLLCFIFSIVTSLGINGEPTSLVVRMIPYLASAVVYFVMWLIVQARLNNKGEEYFAKIG